ncbi:hypothetical protein ACVBEQ_27415 [Nakamurella sp. GG22]
MDAPSPPSDAERQLEELRRRAYGPHPDIQNDPAALAKLTELEAARTESLLNCIETKNGGHAEAADGGPAAVSLRTQSEANRPDSATGLAPVVASKEDTLRSSAHRFNGTLARRFVAGALVAVVALGYTVAWLDGPDPDATLRPTARGADELVLSMLERLGAESDPSSMRSYQTYAGYEPWFFMERPGFQCFMLIHVASRTVDGANCVPPEVDLFADTGEWPFVGNDYIEGLPDGSVIRFHYRGDSVDVFVYPASGVD